MSWLFKSFLESAREKDKIMGEAWLRNRRYYDQSLNDSLKFKSLSRKAKSKKDKEFYQMLAEGSLNMSKFHDITAHKYGDNLGLF